MGDPESEKQIFFTNLLLLGFDPAAMERKWRIPFNKDMFLLPNKQGFETVMHFLFSRLNTVRCKEDFRDCWPVHDKKQEQQFRRVCHDWLTNIVKNDKEAVFPRIVASIFMSPGGARFTELLLCFSSYTLLKVAQRENGLRRDYLLRPVMTSQAQTSGLAEVMDKGIYCSSIRLRTKFLAQAQKTCAIQNTWKKSAVGLVKTYRGRTKANREKEQHLRAEIQRAAERGVARDSPMRTKRKTGMLEYDYDVQSVRRAQKVQKVRDMWRDLEEYVESHTKQEEIVESILQGSLEKYHIDVGELDIKVPDLLLRQCEQEIQRRGIDNIYQGGKLNLLSLIQLWNLSLHLYLNKLNQAGVPNFEETLPAVTSQVHVHQAHLANIQALRLKLEMEVLPEIKKSIGQLKAELDSKMFNKCSPSSAWTTSLGLGLLPPTPPVSFEPGDSKTPKDGSGHLQVTDLKMPKERESTPEAAAMLMKSISDCVRLRQDQVVHGSPLYGPKSRTIPERSLNRLPSKLPTAMALEKVGSKQKTLPMATPAVVKVSPAGTKLKVLPTAKHYSTKYGVVSQQRNPLQAKKEATLLDSEGFKVPQTIVRTNKLTKRSQKSETPHVVRHVDGGNTSKAEEILADKIVDAMMNSSSSEQDGQTIGYLDNPMAELDSDVFNTKDKLSHSPVAARHGTWHDSLLHDSVGPLSSTRVDQSGRLAMDRKTSDPLATKLFSPDNDDVFTIPAVSSSHSVTESGTTLHQYRPHLSRVRAASPLCDNIPSSISSISPQSDHSSRRGHDKRQSTLINEIECDKEQDETLQEEDFLLQEILAKQADSPNNHAPPYTGLESGSQSPDYQQLKRTPQAVKPTSRLSPPLFTQLEEAANSLVDSMLNSNNNSAAGDLDNSMSRLSHPHELYQSLLQTNTPCLRTQSVSNQLGITHTSQRTVPGSKTLQEKLLTKNTNLQVNSNHNSNDEDHESVEESVRVIRFQDGSFSEFLDNSPAKTPSKSTSRFSKSMGTPTRSHPSPLKVMKDELDKTTDNLLAQCQKLVKTVQTPEKHEFQKTKKPNDRFLTEKDVLREGAKPKPLPLISETPTMSFMDSYLKTSPPPGKYGDRTVVDDSQSFVVKKFTLDLDSSEEESMYKKNSANKPAVSSHRDEIHKCLSALESPSGILRTSQKSASINGQRTHEKHRRNDGGILEESMHLLSSDDLDLMRTPFKLNSSLALKPAEAASSSSPSRVPATLGLSTFPLSPYTDTLHNGATAGHKSQTWDDLFREDSSCLLPTSPTCDSPLVGNLINF